MVLRPPLTRHTHTHTKKKREQKSKKKRKEGEKKEECSVMRRRVNRCPVTEGRWQIRSAGQQEDKPATVAAETAEAEAEAEFPSGWLMCCFVSPRASLSLLLTPLSLSPLLTPSCSLSLSPSHPSLLSLSLSFSLFPALSLLLTPPFSLKLISGWFLIRDNHHVMFYIKS